MSRWHRDANGLLRQPEKGLSHNPGWGVARILTPPSSMARIAQMQEWCLGTFVWTFWTLLLIVSLGVAAYLVCLRPGNISVNWPHADNGRPSVSCWSGQMEVENVHPHQLVSSQLRITAHAGREDARLWR